MICFSALLLAVASVFEVPPPYPGIESWKFREELARPEQLKPVSTNGVKFVRGSVDGFESYRIDIAADGQVTITTEDDEGLRRALYYYQDRVRAGDLKSCIRKPWVRNRISRCFFGPIKRPPLNHDELMDDVDYYPEAYLDRLAHEGINGLWLTVEWRDLAETSFTRPHEGAERRLAKLRKTVDKCLKYGIKTWIFCIEPRRVLKDDPLYRDHPEFFEMPAVWGDGVVMCPSVPGVRQYIEESVRDIFTKVPRLGGVMMISHGERPTTCLSAIDPVTGARRHHCRFCDKLEPWQIHNQTASAIVRGMRTAGSDGEYISWFYQPYVRPERAPWSAEVARHLPEGVTLAYNFESGAIKDQLGRFRNGGDYWLSYVGPAEGFKAVADAGRTVNARIGAKIQVGNSHECATVPFVPVPGLLYRKYRAMKEAGVSTVLQCWYFGNYPGIMNKAAGELAFETFEDDEEAFLKKLAAPYWGGDAALVARIWQQFSDAYAEYPLSNDMQYYGPFHAGLAWPLYADVSMKPLGRTWKPLDPPSGDTIGEALENHTLEEAAILARRMALGTRVKTADGADALAELASRWSGDFERRRDLGVMKALACQFESGANIFSFYLNRAKAVYESRERGNFGAAVAAVDRMTAALDGEVKLTNEMLPLAEEDSRLGFHSEAEAHQYHPAKLRWRLGTLEVTRNRLREIRAELSAGRVYPLSDFEKSQPSCTVGGDWTEMKGGSRFRIAFDELGDMLVTVEQKRRETIRMATMDAVGASWYRQVEISETDGAKAVHAGNVVTPLHEVADVQIEKGEDRYTVSFRLLAAGWGDPARRPGYVAFVRGVSYVWPGIAPSMEPRLNLWPMHPDCFGRIVNGDR